MDPPPPTTTTTKLRLMCSYNGHILPRPHSKSQSLTYAGGETRIISLDRRTSASSLSALIHHLSRTLHHHCPFSLKYQLPNQDLDSLISISTDEDLFNMLEEHDRTLTSPTPSRIRLFLFPTRPESLGSLLLDPKSESWFSDALKSTMIVNINRALSEGSGLDGETLIVNSGESLINGGKCGGDSGSVPESMVLETCSSFGSIGSSVSGSNSVKVKGAASGLTESDNAARIYQDQVLPESESIIYNPASPVKMAKDVQVSGYQMPYIADQRQQPVQYIHPAPPHYVQYPPGPQLATPSYYPMYVPYQQPPPNPPYPVYIMPVDPTGVSSNIPAPARVANSHGGFTEVRGSQAPAERVAVTPQPTPTYENEYDNDLVYAQIYKSQPSAPAFLPQKFETLNKAEQAPLSDASTQVPIGTSQQ